jgi:hypothetical protein
MEANNLKVSILICWFRIKLIWEFLFIQKKFELNDDQVYNNIKVRKHDCSLYTNRLTEAWEKSNQAIL